MGTSYGHRGLYYEVSSMLWECSLNVHLTLLENTLWTFNYFLTLLIPKKSEYVKYNSHSLRFRMSFPVLSISAPARHLVLTWFILVIKESKYYLMYTQIFASVSNIWRWWGWPSELPGVYCHDERQDPPRPQDLQQTGGMGGIQTVYQTRNEGIIINIR